VCRIRACSLLVWSFVTGCGAKSGLLAGECGADAGCCVPTPETCNGLDDDCDGAIDDGLSCFFLNGTRISPVPSVGCGEGWYRYDTPDQQSANPVPDIRRSGEVVVAIQSGPSCGGAYIAIIADLPKDGSGGHLNLDFAIQPADSAGLVLADEPSECEFDPSSGTGVCSWGWQPCCTDGALLGKLTSDACVKLDLGGADGVADIVALDGPTHTIPLAFESTFEICSQIRPLVP